MCTNRKMVDIELDFTDEEYEFIKDAARVQGISIDEFISDSIQAYLDSYEPYDDDEEYET